jgi:dienelactone hydrolase
MLQATCLIALAATPLALGEPSGPASTHAAAPTGVAVAVPLATPSQPESRAPHARQSTSKKYKYEKVEYKTRDKRKVHAAYFEPRKKKGKAPAAMLVHDAGSSSADLMKVADSLQRKGFAVLIPDLRGHGDSVTENCDWSKITDTGEQMRTWTFSMRDLEASTDFLRDRDNVHNAKLSLVGVGAGCVLAARYAVHDENANSVALLEPTPDAFGFNMLKDIIELGGLPVLILSTAEGRQVATRIQTAAHDANDGLSYVSLKTIKPKTEGDIFSDKRLNTELTKFLKDKAEPSRR